MKKIGRFLTSILGGFLGLFTGLSGCSSNDQVSAYMGPPPHINGTVLDSSSGTPISNIRIELLREDLSLMTYRTGGNGDISLWLNYGDENKTYTLKITDTDGADNGGEYKGATNTFLLDYSTNTTIELEKR